jgi:D-alanyl-lipoteichoic acid acyltransferase DltB (MBOAT superfamily)
MLFNSLSFLLFFPVVTIVYFLLPHRWRWLHLLVSSCVFYMCFVPAYILILAITIVIDYLAGIWIERSEGRRRDVFLWISIVSTCLVLFVFKYYNFFISNFNGIAELIGWNYSIEMLKIILPIGLSFHTFQSLSYVIEVYRRNQKAETDFGIYSLYVMYYPQLVAGPIERPQNLLHQFKTYHPFRYVIFMRGLRLIVYGFFMKLVVADRLAIYVDAVYNNYDKHSGVTLALATFFFSFQIYCDFAGYSLIAQGVSRVMGINLMTNFRMPYRSRSVSEFWRRWHISLSTWFKDYLYISLGGNRVRTKARAYLNLLITFVVSGLWHGANWTFMVWGGLNGVYLVVENLIRSWIPASWKLKRLSFLAPLYVFFLILISWIFFRSTTIGQGVYIVKSILHLSGKLFVPVDPEVLINCLLAVGLIIVFELFFEWVYMNRRWRFDRKIFSRVMAVVMLFAIVLLGVFDGGQFIYFQF